jgi:hypothetical protein
VVQAGWGGNNAFAQSLDIPHPVFGLGGFNMLATTTYTAVCSFTSTSGAQMTETQTVITRLSGAVNYEFRQQQQISGFVLTGYAAGGPQQTGEAPVVGGPCTSASGITGAWTSVTRTAYSVELDHSIPGAAVSLRVWPLPAVFTR